MLYMINHYPSILRGASHLVNGLYTRLIVYVGNIAYIITYIWLTYMAYKHL